MITHSKRHGQAGNAGKIASVANAFNKDQQIRINALNSIAAALRRRVPIGTRAAAPGCSPARLIPQIGTNHIWIALVALYDSLPVTDPARFGVGAVVPKGISVSGTTAPLGIAAMVI